ncbi:hypothetical protein HDE_01767 [Halotydeus destructor]|nr:hypothetical protein HDE_01767 [Halotydeus destructor]
MFWGIKLTGPKNLLAYSNEDFIHVVNVALEPPSFEYPIREPVQLYIVSKDKEFLVATLDRDNMNASVDTVLDPEDSIYFRIKGNGIIHLTGYVDDAFDYDDSTDGSTVSSEHEAAAHFQGLRLSNSGCGFLQGEPKF